MIHVRLELVGEIGGLESEGELLMFDLKEGSEEIGDYQCAKALSNCVSLFTIPPAPLSLVSTSSSLASRACQTQALSELAMGRRTTSGPKR